MTSPKACGPGKNKRQWMEEEDDYLVGVVKYLVTCGTFKADSGFKPGFLNVVEEKFKSKLQNSGLKAQPYINSRLRHFKNVHAIVSDMVVGHSTSGFGWDFEKKTVTAEKDVWKQYLQGHPKAVEFKSKPCPHYEDLCIIFGKDCASGAEARGFQDVEDE